MNSFEIVTLWITKQAMQEPIPLIIASTRAKWCLVELGGGGWWVVGVVGCWW